jgi:hypothetical protein
LTAIKSEGIFEQNKPPLEISKKELYEISKSLTKRAGVKKQLATSGKTLLV